jgi:hypothetical protein
MFRTPREPQGTSATAGSASSRSASEQGDSAKREKPCEPGRRHLVVNSQVSDKAARRASARAASSARHFRMPFSPHRAKRGSGFSAESDRRRPQAVAVRHAKRSARGPYGYRQQRYPRLWKIFPFKSPARYSPVFEASAETDRKAARRAVTVRYAEQRERRPYGHREQRCGLIA